MSEQPVALPEPTAAPKRPRMRRRARTPQEARQWRHRLLGYALAATACIVFVNALVGENGYLATIRARRDAAALQRELREVREENQQMRARIARLKQDPGAVEEEARRELFLSKPGETMVVIQDAAKPSPTPAPPDSVK